MFDAYRKWLGIPPKDQPPNHYRLLGLELFEDDLDVIEGAADRQMAFIRQYQSGEHAADAARILNEVATARLCLLKPATKASYDTALREELAPSESNSFDFSIHGDDLSPPAVSTKLRTQPTRRPSAILPIVIGGSIGALIALSVGLYLFGLKKPSNRVPASPEAVAASNTAQSNENQRTSAEPLPPPDSPTAEEALLPDSRTSEEPSGPPVDSEEPAMPSPNTDMPSTSAKADSELPASKSTSPENDGEWTDLLEWSEGIDWSPSGINWNDNIAAAPTQAGIRMKASPAMRFPLPAVIEGDYEMEVEFQRQSGVEAIAIYFPVGIHTMRMLLSAETGKVSHVAFLNGQTSGEHRPAPITNGELHRVSIRVRHADGKASFNVDLDNVKNYFQWKGDSVDLMNHDQSGWSTTMLQHPWIGSWNSDVLFQKIRVRMHSGTVRRSDITPSDREQDLKNGLVRLVGEKPESVKVGAWRFVVNQTPLELSGMGSECRCPLISRDFKFCDNYYGAQAPSTLQCPIPKGAKSFSTIGYNDSGRDARFLILVDGEQIHDSKKTGVAIMKVDLPANSSLLELVAAPAGNTGYDHTFWCYPRFHTVVADRVTDKNLDDKRGTQNFKIASSTAKTEVTHNKPFGNLQSGPVHFRDAVPCDEFLFAHAPSSLKYQVPQNMVRFTAIGYNVVSHTVKYEVWADARRIYESPMAGITAIDVKLPLRTKTIELKTVDVDGNPGDQSIWCYPRLHRK